MGWQEYDRTFRRQAAIDTSLPWNVLVPGLQAATLLGNRSGPPGLFCGLCREPDHSTGQCALSVTQQPASSSSPATFSRRPRRPETIAGICASWNQGRCAFPGYCSFRHICAVCRSNHRGGVLTAPSHQWARSIIGVSSHSGQVPRPLSAPKHRTEFD